MAISSINSFTLSPVALNNWLSNSPTLHPAIDAPPASQTTSRSEPIDTQNTGNHQPRLTINHAPSNSSLDDDFQATIQKVDPEINLHGRRLEFTRHYNDLSISSTRLYTEQELAPTYTKTNAYSQIKVDTQLTPGTDQTTDKIEEQPEFLSTSVLTKQLHKATYEQANRFRGLGMQLNELINSGETSFSQTITNYLFSGSSVELPHVDFSTFKAKKKDEVQSFELALTTASGARVNLTLKSYDGYGKTADISLYEDGEVSLTALGKSAGFRSTEIEFSIDGDLTEREKQQIFAFSENLEKLSQGTLGDDVISGLSLADFSAFDSVKLKGFGIDLQYKNTSNERSFTVKSGGNTAKITVDKGDLVNASVSGFDQAMEHYLKLINDAGEKSKAEGHITLMQDVFKAGFQKSAAEQQKFEQQSQQRDAIHAELNAISNKAPLSAARAKNGLISLPDFDFSYSSMKTHPNGKKPGQEYNGFDLTLGLHTETYQRKNQTHYQQTQSYQLEAAYHEPLLGHDFPDFDNQNYRYTTINQEYQKVTDILTQDNQLLGASTTTTGESKITTKTYEFGELTDADTDHKLINETRIITELLTDTELSQEELSEELLLQPNS